MEDGSIIEFIKGLFGLKGKASQDLSPEEMEFLKDFLELRELSVSDFLIPRNQIFAIGEEMSWEEVKEYIVKHPRSLYPTYQGSLDHYTGYISLKDLVRGFSLNLFNWKDYIKPPLTFPENLSIFKALEKFKEKEVKLAFVIDEHSELTGIIRLEDIFEYLIFSPAKYLRADPQGWIRIPAITKLHILEKSLGFTFPEGDYETLSGFIISHLDRIPQKGEKFLLPPIEVEILEADERKIKEIRLRKIS